jgi:hypothetical protein
MSTGTEMTKESPLAFFFIQPIYCNIVPIFRALCQCCHLCLESCACSPMHLRSSYSFFPVFLDSLCCGIFFALIVHKNMPRHWKYIQ